MALTARCIQDDSQELQKVPDELEASRSSRKQAWENLQKLRWVLLDSDGMKLPPPAKKTIDLEGTLIKDGVRKAMDRTMRTHAPNAGEDPGTDRNALGMVNQYVEDLRDGFRIHPGVGVGTYIAKAEALIELLEIHECGSVGGFDPDSGGDSLHGLLYLEQRFEALKRKHAPKKKKSRGA